MTYSRRKILGLVGGGVVLAAVPTGAFLATRTPTRALAPWDAAGQYSDPRMRALSYALLAPNPHNRQPWEAKLEGQDTIILTRDPTRNLPETDPFGRQLTIGMGCFIELMVQAAAQQGYGTELDLFPQGEGPTDPVAVARLVRGTGKPDPLFAAVMDRRSCKEPFDMNRPVPASALDQVLTATTPNTTAAGTTAPDRVAALRELTWNAWSIEIDTERTYRESVDLFRIGKREIEANPDGIDLGGPFLEALGLLGQLDREQLLDRDSMAYQSSVDMYRDMLAATPAYIWLTSPGNSRADQIDAGRAWVRINLATTLAGLSLHPVSQALQEFPEMQGPYGQAHEMLAAPGETVQMLGRLGYGPAIPRTPRWPLEARMIDA